MKRTIFFIAFIAVILLSSGCSLTDRIFEGVLSDVEGWDLSACVDGFSTCVELITDNQDKFITS